MKTILIVFGILVCLLVVFLVFGLLMLDADTYDADDADYSLFEREEVIGEHDDRA